MSINDNNNLDDSLENNVGNVNVSNAGSRSKRRLPPSINVSVNDDDSSGDGLASGTSNKNDVREKRENMLKYKLKSRTQLGSKGAIEIMNYIENDSEKGKKKKIIKKREKLTINNYETIMTERYKMEELKKMCMQYKITRVGNKDDIMRRLYNYCKDSIEPLKIQKVFRGHLVRKLHKLQGPAFISRKICTNEDEIK